MSKTNIILSLLIFFHYLLHTTTADPNPNTASNFIKSECRATLYPSLCIQSLTGYSAAVQTSPKQLARASLSVSLSHARLVSTFISSVARMRGLKPIEYVRVKDCVANMGSAVGELERAMKAVDGMEEGEVKKWHQSNVESWVGAAITFQQTCLDGFRASPAPAQAAAMVDIGSDHVEISIRKRVVDCAHITSIALALFHRYAVAAGEGGAHETETTVINYLP